MDLRRSADREVAMKIKTILVLALLVLLAILFVQNTAVVRYQFLFWTISLSQVILAPLLALIGFLTGFLVGVMSRRATRSKP
jgi:uncharacterized integral membrane protein